MEQGDQEIRRKKGGFFGNAALSSFFSPDLLISL